MKKDEFIIWRTARPREFLHDGKSVFPPENWVFVPAGDPGITRKIKANGEYWLLVHKRKNRIESLGVWTSEKNAENAANAVNSLRADEAYQKKLDSARRSREKKQTEYCKKFRSAVVEFLDFAPEYGTLAEKLADIVTARAVPVGSGTVARTERIPLPRRAEAAVIAWLRHQTTAYDSMHIARIKGARRNVRRQLAETSRQLLAVYRAGGALPTDCPLSAAIEKAAADNETQ